MGTRRPNLHHAVRDRLAGPNVAPCSALDALLTLWADPDDAYPADAEPADAWPAGGKPDRSQRDEQARTVGQLAKAVGMLGPYQTEGIFLDGRWQANPEHGHRRRPAGLDGSALASRGGLVELATVPWAWAYPITAASAGLMGYLVVGAGREPATQERLLLQVLAWQAGASLASLGLHGREQQQAAELAGTRRALGSIRDVHDRLTQVAQRGGGQDGIARAVNELTGRSVAIEDRFGNLRTWAGPGRPDPYPKDDPARRDALLARAAAAHSPLRDGDRLVSVALLAGSPAAVVAVSDPDGTAGDAERIAIEHATTVLALEVSLLRGVAESEPHERRKLVLDLVTGSGEPGIFNTAEALGYDLGRPHRVITVEARRDFRDIGELMMAVGRAAADVHVGSLLAVRRREVIVLADAERSWERFRASVVAELHGGSCRMGVGATCHYLREFPGSYREAHLALRIQKAVGSRDQVTLFEQLGVYQVLGTARETAAMERFVRERLGVLMDYDALHGTQLILTLSQYLDYGGNYDSSARALSVHRNTLKYRLRRIREVSGQDLGEPDTQFNLQFATRAWRTLQAMREP